MVLTVHRWFAAKACPGQYLLERHGEIAVEVTRRLQEEVDDMTEDQIRQIVRDEYTKIEAERAAQEATMPDLVADAVALGISADGSRPPGPDDPGGGHGHGQGRGEGGHRAEIDPAPHCSLCE